MHSWNQLRSGFAAARPVDSIRLTSGGGYGGSVLTKYVPDSGTWYVDGVDTTISTTTFTLTDAHSGKKITFRTTGGFISNVFETFMYDDLDNLAYWFDASDTANMTLSSGVQQWLPRAGTGQFDQATAGSRPSHSATGRNGRPAVSGDGTADHMIASNMSAWPDENETETMFALAFCPNTAALEFRCIYGHGSASTKVRQLLKRDTNGGSTQQDKAGFTSGTGATDTFVVTPAPTMLGVDTIVCALVKAATIDVIVNGQYTAQKTGLTFDSDGNTGGSLFKFPFGGTTGYWPGSVQEIVGYSDELITLERQKVEGCLAHRWGVAGLLAAGHPYKTLGPRIS